jgi:hypothetical protein
MKTFRSLIFGAVAVAGVLASSSLASAATYTYVGSWQVYDPAAPTWFGNGATGPTAYTATEAAALLFGGTAADYVISTVDANPLNINHQAWYDVIGVGGNVFAENYFNKYLGLFYGPTAGYNCCGSSFANSNAASAFVQDNFVTDSNFAFRVSAVPVPAALPLFAAGLGVLGVTSRRKRKASAAV